jgi:hypothetical protein
LGLKFKKYGPRSAGGRLETIDWRGAHMYSHPSTARRRRHQADAPAAEIVTLETSKRVSGGRRAAHQAKDLSARACAKNRRLFVESSQPRVINIFKTHKQPTDSITRRASGGVVLRESSRRVRDLYCHNTRGRAARG